MCASLKLLGEQVENMMRHKNMMRLSADPNMYASLKLLDEQVENMMRHKITISSSQYVCQPEAAR